MLIIDIEAGEPRTRLWQPSPQNGLFRKCFPQARTRWNWNAGSASSGLRAWPAHPADWAIFSRNTHCSAFYAWGAVYRKSICADCRKSWQCLSQDTGLSMQRSDEQIDQACSEVAFRNGSVHIKQARCWGRIRWESLCLAAQLATTSLYMSIMDKLSFPFPFLSFLSFQQQPSISRTAQPPHHTTT